MSLANINHSPTHTQFCNCAICRSLHNARVDLSAVPVTHMGSSHIEREAVNLIVHAERLLGTAQSILQQHHVFERPSPQQSPQRQQQQASSPSRGPNDIISNKTLTNSDGIHFQGNQNSPAHSRQASNPWIGGRSGSVSPPKQIESADFQDTLRARAAELGILRINTNILSPPLPSPIHAVVLRTQQDVDSREQSKFIVCDHCRSHGIRCNEASVCKECILREVPCTHRQCDVSPQACGDCPRTVCFYVHEDWMPDVHGVHNPADKNWLILPGKIREHLSAGQLSKLPTKTEMEIRRCYAGVEQRQRTARDWLKGLVEAGQATWENAGMACRCKEIELEDEKTKALEIKLRRMNVNKIDQATT